MKIIVISHFRDKKNLIILTNLPGILVCLCYCNKTPQTDQLISVKFIIILETGKGKIKAPADLVSGKETSWFIESGLPMWWQRQGSLLSH